MRLFESFRIRGFRYLWLANALSNWAGEMETLILGWYVLVETGSPFLLGLFGALRWGGTLLSPLYGVLADRMDGRWGVSADEPHAARLSAPRLSGRRCPVPKGPAKAVAPIVSRHRAQANPWRSRRSRTRSQA